MFGWCVLICCLSLHHLYSTSVVFAFVFVFLCQNTKMIENCIFSHHANVYFLFVISKYIKKGDISNEKGKLDQMLENIFDEENEIVNNSNLFENILFYFIQLCKNGDVKLSQSAIEDVLNKCKHDKCQ